MASEVSGTMGKIGNIVSTVYSIVVGAIGSLVGLAASEHGSALGAISGNWK
jgi:hypothetical protein